MQSCAELISPGSVETEFLFSVRLDMKGKLQEVFIAIMVAKNFSYSNVMVAVG